MRRRLSISRWWLAAPGLLIALLLLDRPRSEHPLHEAEWLAAGNAVVRTLRAGSGDTTLLLLHGFAESLFTWRAVVDPLALRYRVIALDLPGFAGSSKPDTSYSLDAMTARLADFVDRWTRGPLIVVGHSMGGQLAAALALHRPSRVRALVLIAPAGWDVGLGGIADSMYAAKARALGWYLSSRAFLLPEHDDDWLREPDSAAAYTLMGDPAYRRATARVLEEFDFAGFRDRFHLVTQPTLLLWGTLDPVIPYAVADSVLEALPCRHLITLPRALHRPQVEVPDTVVAEILRFAAHPACERSPQRRIG